MEFLQQYFRRYIRNNFPLKLSDYDYRITSEYNVKNITYYDMKGKEIGYIEYKPYIGKICLFFITNPKYRNRGLGQQILNNALDDIKCHGTERAWLVTNKCPHMFWEMNQFTYTKSPDPSVTLHGYTRIL
jgi:N-acetylglutamate synthase-like GNAT family acetyltransferase